MIVDLLDELRTAVPECRLAAYIDLETALVLASSAPEKPPQETLDAIAEAARRIMPRSDDPLTRLVGNHANLDQAIFHTSGKLFVFVRSNTELICCQCAPDSDVRAAVAGAREILNCIGVAD